MSFFLSSECKSSSKADILFLIDGSGSVRDDGFRATLDFLKSFVRMFTLGANETQFALIVFGNGVDRRFDFNTFQYATLLEQAIDNSP